jgi:hypothetical protein
MMARVPKIEKWARNIGRLGGVGCGVGLILMSSFSIFWFFVMGILLNYVPS